MTNEQTMPETDELTIEELRDEVEESIGNLVARLEHNFTPRLGEDVPEYPEVDGELFRETRSLVTKLTREEVEAHAQELAETLTKLDALERIVSSLKTPLKALDKALSSRKDALRSLVRRKERVDAVPCAHVLSADASRVEIIRLDTGSVVEKRKPKAGEGQTRLGGM